MKYFSLGLLVVFVSLATAHAQRAVPPSPLPVVVTLKDGSQISLIGKGNGYTHWSETTDGYTVVENEQGFYEYAIKRGNRLVGSGLRAIDPSERSLTQTRQLLSIPKHLQPEEIEELKSLSLSPLSGSSSTFKPPVPSKGNIRLLAVCIDYPDLSHTLSVERISQILNDGVNGKPSFAQYFRDNSYGQLNLTVDVAGWVTAPKNYEYYGDKNGKFRSRELVESALRQVDATVDFGQYDNDIDGDVDGVIIVHAGLGAEEGNQKEFIWSHQWSISNTVLDGKMLREYAIHPETRSAAYGGEVGIGIFCHEFGHLLNLPDLYDTDGSSHGIGEWGLMSHGSWLGREDYPASLSAWSKVRLGWVEPDDITNDYGTFSLRPSHAYSDIKRISTGRSGEYFLLENRQKAGFDTYLKGTGLAIWHVDENKTAMYPFSNWVNRNEDHKGVQLEEADGRKDLDYRRNRSDAGDLFPGTNSVTTFDFNANPSSESYSEKGSSGLETGISIDHIRQSGANVSFVHKRVYSNSGDQCDLAHIALEGTNRAATATEWFLFTMPRTGGLRFNSSGASFPTRARVYLSCGADEPLQDVTSYNDQRGQREISLKYLSAGQQVYVEWLKVEGEAGGAFEFEVIVEDQISNTDSLALVAMYKRMGGTNWKKKQRWLQSPVSGWEGVTVKNNRVVALEFSDAGLSGSLPDAFYELNALHTLVLENNQIRGSLEGRIQNFEDLRSLILREPSLTASFMAELPNLKQLTELRLNQVQVEGQLPSNIGALRQLKTLVIKNGGLSGAIPVSIGNAKKLQTIDFSANRMNGSLPKEMGNLTKLRSFAADKNLLKGELPAAIMQLPDLERLSLEDNLMESLPGNLFHSNRLKYINISRNSLTGSLPTNVNRSSSMPLQMNLSDNSLSGDLKNALTKIVFTSLDLSGNEFSGSLPKLKVREFLGLENNRFSQISALPDMNGGKLVVTLGGNQLSFEDLVHNVKYLQCEECEFIAERYRPQRNRVLETSQIVREGASVNVSLDFDQDISTNQYQWYFQDQALSGQTSAVLELTNFRKQQEGSYRCRIRNTELPELTLWAEGIELKLKNKEVQQISITPVTNKNYKSPDFTLAASTSSDLPLTFEKVSGPINLDGNKVSIQGTGEAVIKVTQSGNADYLAAEKEMRFIIAKATQRIEAVAVNDKVFGDAPFVLQASATSGLPVSANIVQGNATLNGMEVSIQGAGEIEIAFTQSGSDNYQAADPVNISMAVAKASQQIAFEPIAEQELTENPINLEATTDASLMVSYRIVSGPARIEQGDQLFLEDIGQVTVEAFQPGDANYRSAQPVRQTFQVKESEKLPQTITVSALPDTILATETLTLDWFSSSQLPVDVTVEGPAVLSDEELYFTAAGLVVLTFEQSGDDTYAAATRVRHELQVSKIAQVISFANPPDVSLTVESVNLEATSSSGLEVSFRLIQGDANLEANQLELLGSGQVIVEAYESGNDFYQEAEPVRVAFEVLPPGLLSQTIVYANIPNLTFSTEPIELNISASSGLPLNIVPRGPISFEGSRMTMQASGSVSLDIFQRGNETYAPSDTVTLSFEILKAPQIIRFTAVSIDENVFELEAFSNSGLPVDIEIESGQGDLQGKLVTMTGDEDVVVRATQSGDRRYLPADPINLTLVNSSITSLTEEEVLNFVAYPNPGDGIFFIQGLQNTPNASLVLYDIRGALLQSWAVADGIVSINLNQYGAGVYQLLYRSSDQVQSLRLVKR